MLRAGRMLLDEASCDGQECPRWNLKLDIPQGAARFTRTTFNTTERLRGQCCSIERLVRIELTDTADFFQLLGWLLEPIEASLSHYSTWHSEIDFKIRIYETTGFRGSTAKLNAAAMV